MDQHPTTALTASTALISRPFRIGPASFLKGKRKGAQMNEITFPATDRIWKRHNFLCFIHAAGVILEDCFAFQFPATLSLVLGNGPIQLISNFRLIFGIQQYTHWRFPLIANAA